MSFGPQTTLTLMVDACTTLPDVTFKDATRSVNSDLKERLEQEKRNAEEEKENALKEFLKHVPSLSTDKQEDFERKEKEFLEAASRAEEARQRHYQLVANDRKKDEKTRPNAFVTVTLDEDSQNGRPIAFTKTYRATKRPFWHESFEEIPIGLLAHGKWGHQLLLSGNFQTYTPTRLNFWIYHDIGDDQNMSEECWKRDEPKRDLVLGRACLSFGSLICNGCETWHELPVLDMFENPISDCKLRVRTQIASALPTPDSFIVQNPLKLPRGIVCGKPDRNLCHCGNDCEGECIMRSAESFSKPYRKQKHCRAKRKKCRNNCCHS